MLVMVCYEGVFSVGAEIKVVSENPELHVPDRGKVPVKRKLPKRWEAKVEMEEMEEEVGLRWKGAIDMTAAAAAAEEEEEEEEEEREEGAVRGGRGRGGEGGSRGGCMSSKCSGTGLGFMGMCGYLSRCREKWTFKLPLVLNRFPQMLHLNGRSPMYIFFCVYVCVWEGRW